MDLNGIDMKKLVVLTVLCFLIAPIAPSRAQNGNAPYQMIWDTKNTAQTGQWSLFNSDRDGTQLGEPVGSGDMNGDGYADIVMAAFYSAAGPGNSRLGAGKLHVHFGGADRLTGVVTDAANPPPDSVEVWGARASDFLGNEVDVDDVTGDGFEDILACAQNADGFDDASNRNQAGALYIITGRPEWPTRINLSAPEGQGVIQILGARENDRCGFWATGGDVNGDGIKDILVSADLAPAGGSRRGSLYIIPGGPNLPAKIDLSNTNQINELGITTINGVDDNDHLGSSIVVGDFDVDGIGDVVVSAGVSRAGAAFIGYAQSAGSLGSGGGDGPGNVRQDTGEVYVIYGRTEWPKTMNLANPTSDVAIYYGDNEFDYFGEDVRAADVDGDGRDELGVGALTADALGRRDCGVGYIFWSNSITRGERVDLASLGTNSRVTRIYGERANDIGADSIVLADIDADGFADVLFGSPVNAAAGRDVSGDLKIMFGSADRLPPIIDTAHPPASVTIFQVIPPDPGDLFTYSLTVGDVDKDGYNDLIPNAMGGDGRENRFETAGDAYVISGKMFSDRAGRGGGVPPVVSRVMVNPGQGPYYAGQSGIALQILCDSTSSNEQFREGAVAVLNGVEVPANRISATELRVDLDDAPEVRNQAGTLIVQVRNPNTGPSVAYLSIDLVGPAITKLKVKGTATSGLTINITGRNILDGATIEIRDATDTPIQTQSVERRKATKYRVKVAGGVTTANAEYSIRILNPGPAPSVAKTFSPK